MSTWTLDEVKQLTTECLGGNEVALHTWLYKAPPFGSKYNGGSRPTEGDRIDIFKQFIVDCYESGKFKADSPFPFSSVSEPSKPTKNHNKSDSKPVRSISTNVEQVKPNVEQFRPVQQSHSLIDLLDNDDFNVTVNSTPVDVLLTQPFADINLQTNSVKNQINNNTTISAFDFISQPQSQQYPPVIPNKPLIQSHKSLDDIFGNDLLTPANNPTTNGSPIMLSPPLKPVMNNIPNNNIGVNSYGYNNYGYPPAQPMPMAYPNNSMSNQYMSPISYSNKQISSSNNISRMNSLTTAPVSSSYGSSKSTNNIPDAFAFISEEIKKSK
eukprot:CAMPEP_0196761450 /NCGR_PEP_ID=MMETSP1095-20130614/691_1 /TAXON_ID=96789 ORGANISM="Chromulina nebulosa, Strain UTEXLB2642" /NCGR_SAMPLE_ID=MMETSP1095 /ASSEMBLY_ACC=CAM_ASM_000446 /LENGTH=324 /DNA_ID=CAMNT_0042111017 /DNA_START=240 /DNA_END=1214 /DNA_ORIENTATION=+